MSVTAPTSAAALSLNNAYDNAMQVELANLAVNGQKAAELAAQQQLLTIENEIATKTYPLGLDQQALEVQVSALQEHLADLVVQVPSDGFPDSARAFGRDGEQGRTDIRQRTAAPCAPPRAW